MSNSPNLFVLGAPKCATTTLYNYLNQHHDICMSEPKEPRCIELRDEGDYEDVYDLAFSHYENERYRGDASPTYLFVPYVAERIHQYYADARMIVILREPVERAFSDWWMHYSRGVEHLSFPEAIQLNLKHLKAKNRFSGIVGEKKWKSNVQNIRKNKRIASPFYIDMGYYGEQLSRYYSYFSKENILIVEFSEFVLYPRKVLENISRFLSIEPAKVHLSDARENDALGVGSESTIKLLRLLHTVRISKFVPTRVKKLVRNWLFRSGEKPTIDMNTKLLLRNHYETDIRRLSELLDRDFSHWGQVASS